MKENSPEKSFQVMSWVGSIGRRVSYLLQNLSNLELYKEKDMHLISKGMFHENYYPNEDINIRPYEDSLFASSCYYFRLGGFQEGGKAIPILQPVELKKNEIRPVFSLETFTLSNRVVALIGPCSELLLSSILLHNSPIIDPGFSGSLELLIENRADKVIRLEPGMRIGKAVFFDIANTQLDLQQYVQNEKDTEIWKARSEAGRVIRKAVGWVEKTIDSEGPKDI